MHMRLVTCSDGLENCGNLCAKSGQSALLSQIVIICGSTKHSDISEISDRLVLKVGQLHIMKRRKEGKKKQLCSYLAQSGYLRWESVTH